MNASQAQIRTHRYTSGWCEAARHDRCKGGYAGTACNCSCHRLAEHPGGTGASSGQMPRNP
jgi:hypothetical protein